MNTYSKSVTVNRTSSINSISLSQRYDQFIESIKFAHYGIMTMAILIGTCLGSITTMFVFLNDAPIWQFIVGMGFSIANLVVSISQCECFCIIASG